MGGIGSAGGSGDGGARGAEVPTAATYGVCDGLLQCAIEDGRLLISVSTEVMTHVLAEGDSIRVVVTVAASGETLVDESLPVGELNETETCGNTCYGTTVTWD